MQPHQQEENPAGAAPSGEGLKKVLIVTYYWPPSGGSGVQRWLKFVKYLPSFGWQPYVFTPENPSFEIRDDSLLNDVPPEAEVLRLPIWEPYHLFRRAASLAGKSTRQTDFITTGKKSLLQGLASWVRGNVFIPDARIFWVKPSVAFLSDLLKSNNIRTLVTTGPPHSMHLIGLKLKRQDPGLRWIVDLRDPWSEWDLLDTLSLTGWARRRHRKLERDVLQAADEVITIAPYHVRRFEALGGRKVNLITNGFDEDDFRGIERKRTSQFTIRHIGMVDELRDPRPFMEAVRLMLAEHPERATQLCVEFVGSVNAAFRNWVIEDPVLLSVTKFRDPVPHAELLKLYGETDVQLLILAHTALAPGNLPGKFFEYLASGNFILGIGPVDGDAAQILNATHAGEMVDRSNGDGIKTLLLRQFTQWSKGTEFTEKVADDFSRRSLTRTLSELMHRPGIGE
jgi:hypothetical protein